MSVDTQLEQEAWAEFEQALSVEIADWKQAVIAAMRERHGGGSPTGDTPMDRGPVEVLEGSLPSGSRTHVDYLLEAGFTGTIKDAIGRTVRFINGVRQKKTKESPKADKPPMSVEDFWDSVQPTGMDMKSAAEKAGDDWQKMPKGQKTALAKTIAGGKKLIHWSETSYRLGRNVALAVAKERGASPELVEKLARIIGMSDAILGWTVNFPAVTIATGNPALGKVSSWLPMASAAYVIYSGMRNPVKTITAAKRAMSSLDVFKGHEAKAVHESVLMESGFTGVIRDSMGREYHFVNGVKQTQEGDPSGIRRSIAADHGQQYEHPRPLESHQVETVATTLHTQQMSTKPQPNPGIPGWPSKAPVRVEPDDREGLEKIWSKLFGDKVPVEAAASLVGALDDAKVSVFGEYDVDIRVTHTKYFTNRTVDKTASGELVMHNDLFIVHKPYQGEGLGADIFAAQVVSCRKAGIKYIETHAARSLEMNGYYTWPLLGYDQPIEDITDRRLKARVKSTFPPGEGFESVQDIFLEEDVTPRLEPGERETLVEQLQEMDDKLNSDRRKSGQAERPVKSYDKITGADWWKVHGDDLHTARFDLSEGSHSLKVLEAYLKKKGKK